MILLSLIARDCNSNVTSFGRTWRKWLSGCWTKILLYLSLLALGVYWASLGHWLYFWGELVWILGFAAIEMNVSEWRDEILGMASDA